MYYFCLDLNKRIIFQKKKKGRVRIQYKYDERYFFRSTVRDQNNKKKIQEFYKTWIDLLITRL